MKHFIIVGGGIGGLATALGLAKLGHNITLLDKKAQLAETGAGIQLAPNAFHALDYLGVGKQVRAKGIDIDELVMMDGYSSDPLTTIPLGKAFRERFNNPYLVIHRCDLHQVLLDACLAFDNIGWHCNQTVIGYRNVDDGVEVTSQAGQVFKADAVIGADGIYSKIRQAMMNQELGKEAGKEPLNLSGHVAYRAVIAANDMPKALHSNNATIWCGANSHIVHYPLENRQSYNIVAVFVTDVANMGHTGVGDKIELLNKMAHFAPLPLSLLKVPDAWGRWVLSDRDPINNWVDGKVVLLGDAAHPTYQYFAQGACMALEDAVNLALNIKGNHDLATSFSQYQQQRMARAYRVVLTSRRLGQLYHASGATRNARNKIIMAKSTHDHYDTLQWLYGYHGMAQGI